MVEFYQIYDDVLSPEDKIKIDYKGPNPFRIYGMLPVLLQVIFHGRGKNVFEDSFKWDITSEPREFYFLMRFSDIKFDKFTTYEIILKTFGRQPSDPNSPNGMLLMEIKGTITTKYKFGNVFEKAIALPFVWLYHLLIYSNVRRRYIQILKERIYQLTDEIRKELGVTLETPELTGASSRIP
jgi:hypothetical protein